MLYAFKKPQCSLNNFKSARKALKFGFCGGETVKNLEVLVKEAISLVRSQVQMYWKVRNKRKAVLFIQLPRPPLLCTLK